MKLVELFEGHLYDDFPPAPPNIHLAMGILFHYVTSNDREDGRMSVEDAVTTLVEFGSKYAYKGEMYRAIGTKTSVGDQDPERVMSSLKRGANITSWTKSIEGLQLAIDNETTREDYFDPMLPQGFIISQQGVGLDVQKLFTRDLIGGALWNEGEVLSTMSTPKFHKFYQDSKI